MTRKPARSRIGGWSRILSGVAVLTATIACGAETAETTGHAADEHQLGRVEFDPSCGADASAPFQTALAELHHMHYEEARESFEALAADNPECAMAHWGVAMTLFQPLWPTRPGPEALQRGLELVQAAQDDPGLSDRDRSLVAATEAFFQDPESADWWTRIRRWSNGMSEAHAAHPEDSEISAFYALSQLAVAPVTEDWMAHNGRAAEVLRALWEDNPRHPGAVHYTIHANDVDGRAGESLDIVKSYGEIAPDVPHALHMPTHIFVRLGQWPEVIEWNRRSAQAALRHPAGDLVSHHYPHALDYLVHAHLQRADDRAAEAVVGELEGTEGPFQPTFISAYHLASTPARWAVERRDWEAARRIEPRVPAGLPWENFWWAEAISWSARGLGAVHSGDDAEAARADERMAELRDAARAAGEEGFAQYIEVDRLILNAWRAQQAGDRERALELAREAVALEASTQKHPVTPGSHYPSAEALGDLLAAQGRHAEAVEAYEVSLERWPGRYNSAAGAAASARAAGDEAAAGRFDRTLVELAAGVDEPRPAVREARARVGA